MIIENKESSTVNFNFKGGGSFINLPPLFSAEGESVFMVWKNTVLEYYTKTGKLVNEYKGLTDQIVGVSYHIHSGYQCITACCESGKVILWKTETHYKIFEKDLPLSKIKTFNIISPGGDDLKALVSYQKKTFIRFAIVDLMRKVWRDFKFSLPGDQNYFIGISERYYSVAYGNSACFLQFSDYDKQSRCFIQEKKTFTCISCHPTEEVVLTGDNLGRVIVWQNIFTKQKTQNVFHWHTLPVHAVCFSTSGSYFFSGGDECVLVKWQFDNVNDKKFIPRIAAEICHITVSSNNTLVAIATKDNAIRIFDNTLNQTTLIQHLVLGKHYECGILYDPRTRGLLLNGNHGHVQFYSPDDMSLLYNVDIVGQNKVTNERESVMINTEITKLALSKSGMWLASVEERREVEYHNEIRLKFWHYCETERTFELNTSIEYPHEKSINSIIFQPVASDESLRCITVGHDRRFKVWQLSKVETVYEKGVMWKCSGVGFHRNLPSTALAFSVDGSLMATGFQYILTVWVPDTCELKCSLVHPINKEAVKHIHFGNSNQCHLLLCASKNQLCVWNILTLSLIWTVPVAVSFLIADPKSEHMALFTDSGKVFVFTPNSQVPVFVSNRLLKKQNTIVAATFVPSKYSSDTRLKWYERSHIYLITSKKELYSLGNNQNIHTEIPEIFLENEYTFTSNKPTTRTTAVETTDPSTHLYEKDVGHKAIKKYLLGPLHTMVPIQYTSRLLLKSLVVQKDVSINPG